jgi:predicted transcriptional regulator
MLETSARVDYLRRLSEGGFDDVLVLSRDTAEEVLTQKRMELLNELAADDAEITSMRDLARRVDRDISIVSRDLDVLFEADVIDYEQSGRSKRPVLAHENVVVEPIVFDGDVPFDHENDSGSEAEYVAA